MPDFFADTYALVAHYKGSKAYAPIFAEGRALTTALNLVEFAHAVDRAGRGEDLRDLLAPLYSHVVDPPREAVLAAARFKRERLEAGAVCSYVDAWGYATARAFDLAFVTGDEDFRGVPGVRFVKA